MTHRFVTFIDVNTAGCDQPETKTTNTFSILTHFACSTVLLLVTARPTQCLDTDLALETVLVAVTHLGAQAVHAALTLGTVRVDLTLGMTQSSATPVTRGTLTIGTSGGEPHTPLLRPRHPGKPLGTRTLDILVVDLAEGVGSTGAVLLARVDALEVDADLVGGTVGIGPAAHAAHTGTAHLAGRALLA